jgi:hypothetical protein
VLLRAVPQCDHGFQPFPVAGPSRTSMALLIQPDSHIDESTEIIRQRLSTRSCLVRRR